jgi:hypothetical protein
MANLIERYPDRIGGILSCFDFDPVLIHGTLPSAGYSKAISSRSTAGKI